MNNEKYYKYCFPISDTNEEDTLFDYQKEAIKNLNNHFNLDISIPGRNIALRKAIKSYGWLTELS